MFCARDSCAEQLGRVVAKWAELIYPIRSERYILPEQEAPIDYCSNLIDLQLLDALDLLLALDEDAEGLVPNYQRICIPASSDVACVGLHDMRTLRLRLLLAVYGALCSNLPCRSSSRSTAPHLSRARPAFTRSYVAESLLVCTSMTIRVLRPYRCVPWDCAQVRFKAHKKRGVKKVSFTAVISQDAVHELILAIPL